MRKRLLAIAAGLAIALGLAACAGTPDIDPTPTLPTDADTDTDSWNPEDILGNPDPALVALVDQLYDGIPDVPMTESWELTPANAQSMIFIDFVEGSKGVISQAMINVIPHALVLLELPEGADTAAVAAQIEANADPNKWICTAAEKLGVFTSGRYIVMVMSDAATVDAIEAKVPAVLG